MAINLDHVTEQITVTDTATDVDLTLVTKGTGSHKFNTGNGEMVRVADSSGTGFVQLSGGTTPYIVSQGSTNANLSVGSNGTGTVFLRTNGGGTTQAAISHTASAVNYVQATGGVTGVGVALSAQGSDSNIAMLFQAKGTQFHLFQTNGANQFGVAPTASAVNYVQVTGSSVGFAPYFITQGSDTNISFAYSAKGTGAHDFYTNGFSFAQQLKIAHTASAVNYVQVTGNATTGQPSISAQGSDTNISMAYIGKGIGGHIFSSGNSGNIQFIVNNTTSAINYLQVAGGVSGDDPSLSSAGSQSRNIRYRSGSGASHLFETGTYGNLQASVSHTASAVNWIQLTGSATGGRPLVSVQGSDTNINLGVLAKGSGVVYLQSGLGASLEASATGNANYFSMVGTAAGTAPVLSVKGSDTNIDITFTPKGTGNVRFGTHTGTADTAISGYIEIKDSGGTIRKLAVIT
jgi:hypothetical protein